MGSPPTPPMPLVGPNFLPGLRPIKNFIRRLGRQLFYAKNCLRRLEKLSTTGGVGGWGWTHPHPPPLKGALAQHNCRAVPGDREVTPNEDG